jgi:Zn-dependent membrane protease YugP
VGGSKGAQIARLLLDKAGLSQVEVKEVQGYLADGYDIDSSTIRLSSDNFSSTSVASAGIAAHEVGHALQVYHTERHHRMWWLKPRMAIYLTHLASWAAVLASVMLFVSLLSQWQAMIYIGVVILLWAIGCSLLTLPVEINASRQAIGMLRAETVLSEEEMAGARKVLRAAAWANVATMGTALVPILRDVMQRDRD